MATKQETLLNGIIFPRLPGLEDPIMQAAILKLIELYPTAVDVENLVEHALAFNGNYKFVDEDRRDFNDIDDSDSKTVTVNINSRKAEIIGLENKIGSIRITVFNSLSSEKISYLYIPRLWVPMMKRECYGINEGKKRFIITWSEKRPKKYKDKKIGYFNQFEKFRVDSFEALAEMTDQKFYQLHSEMDLIQSSLPLKTSSPRLDSLVSTKSPSIPQTSSPCKENNDLQQNLDFEDTQSISLYEKSL